MTAKADSLFNASQVAAVTGSSARLQGQRYAHHIYTHSAGDRIPCGHGDDRYVTAETIYRIAITEAVGKANVPIRLAANAAGLFSEDQRGRRANTLYEFGRTLLKISEIGDVGGGRATQKQAPRAEIINAPFDALLADVCGKQAAFIIDLGPIIKSVNENLSKLKRNK